MFKKNMNLRSEALPQGWEAKKMNGETVYVNHVTKETQWDRPTMADATGHGALKSTSVEPSAAPSAYVAKVDGPTRKTSSSRRREELPHGWRKAKTKEGETLYMNDIERITSWDPPVAIAPPATAPSHGSEGRHKNRRRTSTASTASNSAPDDDLGRSSSSSRDKEEESGGARRRRPSNDSTSIGVGIDTSQGRHERVTSSSSGRHRSRRSSSAKDECDEEPGSPLPEGWRKDYTKSGRPYYRNSIDEATSWEKPKEASTGRAVATHTRSDGSSSSSGGSSSSSSSRDTNDRPKKIVIGAPKGSSDSPLPAGWSMAFTESGKPYYRNDRDQSTSWDRPTEASDRRAVASGSGRSSSSKGKRQEQPRPARISNREQRETRTGASDPGDDTGGSRGRSRGRSRDTNDRPTKANLAPGSPLPAGWSKAVTKSGETYYRNDHGQTTTWDRPTEASDPRAAVASSSGHQQEQPLPPGWSQVVTADGRPYYRNHNDRTTSWDRPVLAPANAARPRAPSTSDSHAPAVFDPTMFGMPPGTQAPPQLQQTLMQQQMMMRGQQQPGQPVGMPMPGMSGGAPPTTALGKGMNFLMTRMAEPPSVKPPPKGYVGLNGGGFTNVGGFNASALRASKMKNKPKKEEPSSLADKAGNFLVNGLNKGINSGLSAVGAGGLYKVKLKKKNGGLKWGGKANFPGLGSGSNSEPDEDEEGGEVNIDLDIDIDVEVEEEEEEEVEEEEEEEEEED